MTGRRGPSLFGESLTETELQVLIGFARGRENAGVGEDLKMPVDTVKGHASRVYAKLGADNRAHAVALAYEHGLVCNANKPGTRVTAKPKPRPQPGPAVVQLPAPLFDQLLAVAHGVVHGRPLKDLRQSANRALLGARANVRDPRRTAGGAP